MKKIVLIPLLLFGTVLTLNASILVPEPDCVQLAIDVADAYEAQGYSHFAAYQAGNWAYEGCISNPPGNF